MYIVVGIVAIDLFVVVTVTGIVIVIWVHEVVYIIVVVGVLVYVIVVRCAVIIVHFSLCSSTIKSYNRDNFISMCQ